MSEKKMVRRSVAITLGIFCVILIAGLGIAVAYYTMTINSKNSTYNDYVSTHSYNDSAYISVSDREAILQGEVNGLIGRLNLNESLTWVNNQTVSQSAGSFSSWTDSSSFEGYVTVNIESSTTSNTYVEVLWSAHGANYDNRIFVGVNGTAVFPYLPPNTIEVRVGNTDTVGTANENVTITFYY